MEYYNVSGGPEDDDELWNINIPNTEGIRDVVALNVPTDPMTQPLNIKKVNIGIDENTKFANVGDYWDEETMVGMRTPWQRSRISCMNFKICFRQIS